MDLECFFKHFYKISSVITTLMSIALLIFINYYSVHNEKDLDALFSSFLLIYANIVARLGINFMLLISQIFNGYLALNLIFLIIDEGVLLIYSIYIFIKHKQTKEDILILIFSLISIIIDISTLISLFSLFPRFLKEDQSGDCFGAYFKGIAKKNLQKIEVKINTIKTEINNLREENKKLNDSANKGIATNIENKKIEVILWYIKNKYNKTFSQNILYQYLLDEAKEKCGITIDKNKLRDIFVIYMKDKLTEYLTCPLTADIFLNPVITPEGQTFDKNYLLKEIKLKKQNPLTRNNLNEKELVENKLVLDSCELLKFNQDKFKMENIFQIRKLLINPKTNKYYSNPYVIKEGDRRGETEDGIGNIDKYSNKVISNIIEQNGDILTNEFMFEINGNNKINKSLIVEENVQTDSRLIFK